MDTSNPHYFNYPPYSNPNYPVAQSLPMSTDIENQVHRWANWVKFVAVYMIIGSSIQFLKTFIELILTPEVPIEIFLEALAIELGYIVVGIVGYKVSEDKRSQNAKKYLIALILLIFGSSVVTFSFLNEIIMYSCNESKKYDSDTVCNEGDIMGISLLFAFLTLLFSLCFCSPVMYCIIKLKKNAEILEANKRYINQNQVIELRQGVNYNC